MDVKAMRAQVREELSHIPDWPEHQPELRLLYWGQRMTSLSKRAKGWLTACQVLEECLCFMRARYPGVEFRYDEVFFAQTALFAPLDPRKHALAPPALPSK
jgi:hypothetical protein